MEKGEDSTRGTGVSSLQSNSGSLLANVEADKFMRWIEVATLQSYSTSWGTRVQISIRVETTIDTPLRENAWNAWAWNTFLWPSLPQIYYWIDFKYTVVSPYLSKLCWWCQAAWCKLPFSLVNASFLFTNSPMRRFRVCSLCSRPQILPHFEYERELFSKSLLDKTWENWHSESKLTLGISRRRTSAKSHA